MSHSKFNKRGYSLYVENWNPRAKKFINTCKICGHSGYSPTIEDEGFAKIDYEYRAIFAELTSTLERLPLDEFGRCEICARVQEGNQSNKYDDK